VTVSCPNDTSPVWALIDWGIPGSVRLAFNRQHRIDDILMDYTVERAMELNIFNTIEQKASPIKYI